MGNPNWYADSAPGGGTSPTLKCGGRISSLGVSVPAGFTVSSDASPITGDRAVLTPGSHPTLPSNPATRALAMGFNTKQTVHFDGASLLYGLPVPTSNGSALSLSCWMMADGVAQGSLLSTPIVPTPAISGTLSGFFFIGTPFGSGVNTSFLWFEDKDSDADDFIDYMRFSGCKSGTTAGLAVLRTDNYMPASTGTYAHVMIGLQTSGTNINIVICVNDTVVYNDTMANISAATFPFGSWTDGASPPTSAPDFTQSKNVWSVGAAVPAFDPTRGKTSNDPSQPNGAGLRCAMTELWVSIGHYVDWTSGVTRNKFHTTDINGNYVPVDIGQSGNTLGFKPSVYCTGGPHSFSVNRANGRALKVLGGSGETIFIPKLGEVQMLNSDDRVPGG